MPEYQKFYLPDIIGGGYGKFWKSRKRYLVCKGSRASKKSKTTAIRLIYNLMKYDGANLLVVRKTYRTLKDSCFTDLKWAAQRLGVSHLWEFKTAPLEATYLPTGQKILFRGLDDPLKIASITVPYGWLCWGWIEEAYEVNREDDFNTLDESLRGELPDHLWKQWTITFNPWNDKHWLKRRFFDNPDDDTDSFTTNYTVNEWLDDADLKLFEEMKQRNPRRYQVAGLGNWGVVDGLVFENTRERAFTLDECKDAVPVCGMDFGYSQDPTAVVIAFLDPASWTIYVWDEIYKTELTCRQIWCELARTGYLCYTFTCDSAAPQSIAELKELGVAARAARKGPDSIMHGIQYMQNFRIVIHPRCVNFITEISNYQWAKDKFGNPTGKPVDEFNHAIDALRYGVEQYSKPRAKLNRKVGGSL